MKVRKTEAAPRELRTEFHLSVDVCSWFGHLSGV